MTLLKRCLNLTKLGLLIIVIVAAQQNTQAQSAIFNVPTTDVLPKHELYVEADYITHPASYAKGGYHSFGPSIVYGVGKKIEIGFNLYFTRAAEPEATELQPNAKWQIYNDEERSGFAAAVGGIAIIPLTERETTNTNALFYVALSQKIKKNFGPTFTTGAYSFVGRMEEGENRTGILLGYEQPVHNKLKFFADWYSGNNSFGYAAAGIEITFPKEHFLYAGYSFGNQGRGNNWLGIFFGRTF
jgi:hypothetical protein